MGERGGPILILYASAGAGHKIAAGALAEAFRAAVPDVVVETHDVLATSNAWFRRLYAGGYLAMVKHAPAAMGILYDALDRPNRPVCEELRRSFQNLSNRRTMRLLIERRPRLIVNTHYLASEIVAYLRRRRRLNCPQVTVTTDYETHRIWVQPPTERYYTATAQGKAYLATWGVDPDRVLVSGIPVRREFEQSGDRDEIRRRCGLDGDRPVVLLLCGGFGVGPTEQALAELMTLDGEVRIVVVAGSNPKLRARLERQVARSGRLVRVLGYTHRMHEWMRAADLVVSKSGGLTVAEALVSGVPLAVVAPIPGQEVRNSDYLLAHGAAVKVNHVRMLGYHVGRVLREPARLNALRAAVRAIAQPGAANRIAADALRLLDAGRD